MNKRQIKKTTKIITERTEYFRTHMFFSSKPRQNGMTDAQKKMLNATYSKKYKPFKLLKRFYNGLFVAIDVGHTGDYSVELTYFVDNGRVKIIRSDIIVGV